MIAAECLGQNARLCSQPTIGPSNLGRNLEVFSCFHALFLNCEQGLLPDSQHPRVEP